MRIVSLVPSLTKTICDLGLKQKLVGITKFCIDPPDVYRNCILVGGTKDPDLEKIAQLKPTHVLINEEENRVVDQKILTEQFNTLNTFPKSPSDVPRMLEQIGCFLGVESFAHRLSFAIREELEKSLKSKIKIQEKPLWFLYLIWKDPWMAVSQDTYISNLLESGPYENALKSLERYPVIDPAKIYELNVDVIFMSSEPWPFRRRDLIDWNKVSTASSAKICRIDGRLMSWFGSMTLEALKYTQNTEKILTPF